MNLKANKNIFQIPQAEKYLTALLPRLQEKRVRSFTTIVLSLFTLSFFGLFAIGPTLSTITDLQKQITDSQFVNDQLQQKITNLTNLQVVYKKMEPNLPIIYTAIPQTPEVTLLVGQLQTVAQDSKVQLLNIQTLPVDVSSQPTVQYNAFSFAMDISGSYDSVTAFLKELTNFNRIVTIDAIALTKPTLPLDTYTLSLRGKAYFKGN